MVLTAYVADDVSDAVDVVGHHDAAEGFDEDEADCFAGVVGDDIAEAHCQHDVGSPVVGPDVLDGPVRVLYVFGHHPAVAGTEVGDGGEHQGDDVRVAEVHEEHFAKFPVLLVLDVMDEIDLYFIDALETLGKFEDNKKPKVE